MIKNLSKEYRSALKDFLAGGGEVSLESAYLLGRQALEQGIGVLDIAIAHHRVLVALLDNSDRTTGTTQMVKQAGNFLAECLSPFEMAQRGFRESITALKRLNENLEDQVEKRTQAIRASQERYRTLIEISPDAITVTDLQGKVTLCNQQSAQLHGYSSPDELIDTYLRGSVAPEDLQYVTEMAQKVIREGAIGNLEYTLITKDGARIPVEVRTALVRDEAGQPSGFVGVNRDVSERKRAQLKLESQERRQAALADLGLRALSGVDMDTLMRETVSLVAQILNVEYCELLELLPEQPNMLLREGIGWKEGVIGKTIAMTGDGSQAGYTLLKSQPVIVESLPEESRFIPPAFLLEHNIVSGMTVIIYSKDQPYGILGAHTSQHRQFTLDEVHFLQAIANVLAMAIDNRNLLEIESKARTRAEADKERALKSLAFVSHER